VPEVQWETDQLKVDRIALGLVAPIAAATLTECLYHSIHLGILVPAGKIAAINYAPMLLFVFLGSYSVALSVRWGREGAVLAGAGLTLALAVIHFYRGSLFWPGILDRSELSKSPTLLSFLGAFGGGCVIAFLSPKRIKTSRIWDWGALSMIALSLVYVWADANRELKIYTDIPYMRHYALTIVVVCIGVWSLVANKWSSE
jgi:hypothetical protein